jgi:hypothetical protein
MGYNNRAGIQGFLKSLEAKGKIIRERHSHLDSRIIPVGITRPGAQAGQGSPRRAGGAGVEITKCPPGYAYGYGDINGGVTARPSIKSRTAGDV